MRRGKSEVSRISSHLEILGLEHCLLALKAAKQ